MIKWKLNKLLLENTVLMLLHCKMIENQYYTTNKIPYPKLIHNKINDVTSSQTDLVCITKF